jgi:class 3 adenylate cyclase/pimeloyl-ACP methyl ester carboxylesterase
MEPQVQYAKTSDGVNIAYYTMGSGPPFVLIISPGSHLLAERRVPVLREALDGTARFFTLVRIDPRGLGLSDRGVADLSLEAMTRDIEAVVEKERLDKIILLGIAIATGPAVQYAASNPEKVSHLILLDPPGPEPMASPLLGVLTELAQVDWELASATIMRSFYGPDVDEMGLADLFKEAVDPEYFRAVREAFPNWAMPATYESLQMPVLVLLDKNNRRVDSSAARKTAAIIPDGHFYEIDNAYASPGAIARFLASTGGAPPPPHPPRSGPRVSSGTGAQTGMTAILFADIVDSTALTERLGDAQFRDKARELDGSLRTIIREHSGIPIEGKLLGDGVLATFASARQAIEAAMACGRAGDEGGLPLHLGLHAGDVIREENNVYGGAVNIASRISGLSAPGEVLVSQTVRDLARTSAGVSFVDRGEQSLKGVGEAVRVWAVREGE